MRVSTADRVLSAEPGTTLSIAVDVVNTGTIIDGLSARLIGLDAAVVRCEPERLPLFPDASGRIVLGVDLPETQQAGLHPLTVEVYSHSTQAVAHADVDVDVAPRPAVSVQAVPRVARGRRSGRFVLSVRNDGNVPLDVALGTAPGDSGVTTRISPPAMRLEPGTRGAAITVVRGPRMLTGGEVDRAVTVEIVGRRQGGQTDIDDVEPPAELGAAALLVLKQRPVVSRGLLTAAILVSIVALWAAVFLLGLTNVFSNDPPAKTAPTSYFPPVADPANGDLAPSAAGAPVGALGKNGLVPAGVGGRISGTVTAASDGSVVGRILVEAFRLRADGTVVPEPVSSTATESDGTYTLGGLFPTEYLLKFTAEGYRTVWYPENNQKRAQPVGVETRGDADDSDDRDVVVTGLSGSISGTVDSGDALDAVRVTVTPRLLTSLGGGGDAGAPVITGPDGRYALRGLTAPGTYELTFQAPGYQPVTTLVTLGGGEERQQPGVLLGAGGGQLSGVVTDGVNSLGNVVVSTTVDGQLISVTTPTTGAVGTYTFADLPTPGTYVVTYTAEGFGSRTRIIELGAGESRLGEDQSLATGTGSVTGEVLGPDDLGLGGVTVTVGGAPTAEGAQQPSTTTLTNGEATGRFVINGLPTPGNYTLTFTREGFLPVTLPVELSDEGPGEQVRVRLGSQLGSILGVVTGEGPSGGDRPYIGASVTATNGTITQTTTSSSALGSLDDGGFLVTSLPPGWYSVTVTAPGRIQQTSLVQVLPGERSETELRLERTD